VFIWFRLFVSCVSNETRDVRADVISTRCRELQLKVRVGRIVCLSVDEPRASGDSSLVRPRDIDGNTSPRAERVLLKRGKNPHTRVPIKQRFALSGIMASNYGRACSKPESSEIRGTAGPWRLITRRQGEMNSINT